MQQSVFPFSRAMMASTALVLVLAGCNGQGRDFDWDLRSRETMNTSDAARNATAPRPNADNRGVISYPGYQVALAQQGDTVASVARRLGINENELARVNAIQPNIALQGGEVLVLPRRVAETLGGPVLPSTATGPVDVSAIATTALDRVNTGPTTGAVIGSTPPATTPSRAPAAQTGKEPVRHRVVSGESAFTVARRYNVTPSALAEWNGLGPDMTLREGQTLLIPPTDESRPAAPARRAETLTSTTVPGQGSPTPQPPSADKPLPKENPTRVGTGNPSNAPASPSLPTSTTSRLAMPVDGSVFKAYQKGRYDGIGISATGGSPVRAAADGTVVTVTRDTSQVSIVMIRHANNLSTVYANLDGISVEKGATVKRGQQIGTVRASNPPFLHFEARRGAESVDPMTLMQ